MFLCVVVFCCCGVIGIVVCVFYCSCLVYLFVIVIVGVFFNLYGCSANLQIPLMLINY